MTSTHINADDFKRFAASLKTADKKLATEIRRELREVGREQGDAILEAGIEPMPSRGGLAAWISRFAKVTVSIQRTRLELQLGIRKKDLIPRLNSSGRLRHPVHARPDRTRKEWSWVDQQVPSGTFSEAFADRKDEAVTAVEAAMRRVMSKL